MNELKAIILRVVKRLNRQLSKQELQATFNFTLNNMYQLRNNEKSFMDDLIKQLKGGN